jgi:hypothetical protein
VTHRSEDVEAATGGRLVQKQPGYLAIGDGVLNHWAHHRGQPTAYLRLNGAPVPTIYRPTADETIEN